MDNTTIVENQMEKKMENQLETLGPLKWYLAVHRAVVPTLDLGYYSGLGFIPA